MFAESKVGVYNQGGCKSMIKFKACPKCHGDINVAEDIFGKYLNCLQCGYLKDLPAPARPKVAGIAAGRAEPAEVPLAA
jgi:hypothetical protein